MKPSKHVDLLSCKYFAYCESNEIGASFKIVGIRSQFKNIIRKAKKKIFWL